MNEHEHIWEASSFGDGEEKCILCGSRKVDTDRIAELEALLRFALYPVGRLPEIKQWEARVEAILTKRDG